jgi:acetaldehyde dehydrogenase (acetylating)
MSADKDLISVQQARDLVEAAHRAQQEIVRFDQAKIDHICDVMAQAALRDSPRTAAMAVEETGYGVAEDKQVKNQFSAEIVWNYFKPLRTVGVVSETKDVVEIASPRGVVAGIIPSTNPTSTAIFKILISIKSRNAIVLVTASIGRALHQRDGEDDAGSGNQRRLACRCDWLHESGNHRRHGSADET